MFLTGRLSRKTMSMVGRQSRGFSSGGSDASSGIKNALTAGALLAMVFGIYSTAMGKMQQSDDLAKVINEVEADAKGK
jgi:hypothetical protein